MLHAKFQDDRTSSSGEVFTMYGRVNGMYYVTLKL